MTPPVPQMAPVNAGILIPGLLIIAIAVLATMRRVDVRVALLAAAVALGVLANQPRQVWNAFARTVVDEKFIVPICSAMAFARVLRYTRCDQHLVHLLAQPLLRFRQLFIPGAVIIGYLVNIPVISQTSTAVAIGSVLVPLLAAARLSPATIGAALLLGSSVGGELLNPGAPELATISSFTKQKTTDIVAHVLPFSLIQMATAMAVFWLWSHRLEARYGCAGKNDEESCPDPAAGAFRVNLLKATVPLLPLLLLFIVGPPLQLVHVPKHWLMVPGETEATHYDSRLVGAAMILGTLVAIAVAREPLAGAGKAFINGLVYAYVHIITLIVAASAFGKGVELIGFAAVIGAVIAFSPGLLMPAAGFLPLSFAVLCGSGMASTQSLFQFFVAPASSVGVDPARVGAIVSLGAAAGRTMSPVAAVALMCGALTNTSAITLVKRVAIPLLLGVSAIVIVGSLLP